MSDRERDRKPLNFSAECFGKTAYCSKGAAIDRIKQSFKRKRKARRSKGWGKHLVLVPYRCPWCHHWHVGGSDADSRPKGC